ncbi:MAG: hypothetical protein VB062_05170 [Christensenella sp.]|nr:hypothetical protein [Christensenella sp.]
MRHRITILTGHYGSGKTSIAAQYARQLTAAGARVTICDLDIVNPYFRTSDCRVELEQAGIHVVASRFSGGTVDVPALPRELGAALAGRERRVLLDVGGDDRGTLALGRYAEAVRRTGDYENLFVVNFFRPRSQTPEDALALLREVEAASGLKVTALVHNSNLGEATTAAHIRAALERMETLSRLTGLPVAFTAARLRLKGELAGSIPNPLWMEEDHPLKRWLGGRAIV